MTTTTAKDISFNYMAAKDVAFRYMISAKSRATDLEIELAEANRYVFTYESLRELIDKTSVEDVMFQLIVAAIEASSKWKRLIMLDKSCLADTINECSGIRFRTKAIASYQPHEEYLIECSFIKNVYDYMSEIQTRRLADMVRGYSNMSKTHS